MKMKSRQLVVGTPYDMDQKSKLRVLRKTTWFSEVPETALVSLAARMEGVKYDTGDVLQQEDSHHGHFFVVLSGAIERKKNGVLIDLKTKFDITGLLHTFQGDPAYASLTASEQGCTVLQGTHDAMHDALKESIDLTESLLNILSRTVRQRVPVHSQSKSQGIKVVVYSSKSYEKPAFNVASAKANENQAEERKLEFIWVEEQLNSATVALAAGADAVCMFTQDDCNAEVLEQLNRFGVELVALRCAGFNNVDIKHANALGLTVVRVPAYSPYAVAEHAVALIMTLNRKIHMSVQRSAQGNYSLEGLTGFDMHSKRVAVIGTGKIGRCTAQILRGFGCQVAAFDARPDYDWAKQFQVSYAEKLEDAWADADIVSLHVPLLPSTSHLVNQESIKSMKKGVMIINTSRGKLINTGHLIDALKSGHVGYAGLDVYEGENEIFFRDNSDSALTGNDSGFALLKSFRNVVVTGHQAFLTREALNEIAGTTVSNIVTVVREGGTSENAVSQSS